MYCATNHLHDLKFLGPQNKPHSVCRLVKHYQICFDPKLGHGIYTILLINYDCTSCTSIFDQSWIPVFPAQQQPRYQPINNSHNDLYSVPLTTGTLYNCPLRQNPVKH